MSHPYPAGNPNPHRLAVFHRTVQPGIPVSSTDAAEPDRLHFSAVLSRRIKEQALAEGFEKVGIVPAQPSTTNAII